MLSELPDEKKRFTGTTVNLSMALILIPFINIDCSYQLYFKNIERFQYENLAQLEM